jgi:penicillin V acylase-like amidase (Ntn superfamily)
MFHFLNTFHIPPGAALPPAGVSEKFPDYTSWTVGSDLAKKQCHWKTYGNENICAVDLKNAGLDKPGMRVIPMQNDFAPEDITSQAEPLAATGN